MTQPKITREEIEARIARLENSISRRKTLLTDDDSELRHSAKQFIKHDEKELAILTLALQAEAMQPRPGRGIYIASKTVHAPKWRDIRKLEHQIISTWIDEAGDGETADFSDLWRRCIEEASNCATLICYRETGEVLKGAFIEIGAALANNRPVICVGDFEGMSFTSHRLVTTAPTVVAAITSLPEPKI